MTDSTTKKQTPADFSTTGCLETRFHGPTNFKGARVSVRRAERRPGDKTIYVPWNYSLSSLENHAAAALAYIERAEIPYTLHKMVYGNDRSYFFGFDARRPEPKTTAGE